MLRKTEVGGSYPLIRLDVAYPLWDFTQRGPLFPSVMASSDLSAFGEHAFVTRQRDFLHR